MEFKLVVCGGRRFSDLKRLHRALDAIHRKHHIYTLITGTHAGAEEMAYFWAVSRSIHEIVTVPARIEALTGRVNYQRRNADLLATYQPNAVVGFSHPETDPMLQLAKRQGFVVWDVPDSFR